MSAHPLFSIYCEGTPHAAHPRRVLAEWPLPLLRIALEHPDDTRALAGLDGLQLLAGDKLLSADEIPAAESVDDWHRLYDAGKHTSVERELSMNADGELRGRVRLWCPCGIDTIDTEARWDALAPALKLALSQGVTELPCVILPRLPGIVQA